MKDDKDIIISNLKWKLNQVNDLTNDIIKHEWHNLSKDLQIALEWLKTDILKTI